MSIRTKLRPLMAIACALGIGLFAGAAGANTYTVSQIGDSGAGSLRQAILDANGHAGADTIQFSLGTITTPPVFINLQTPLPAITGDVTIIGAGAGLVLVQPDPVTMPTPFPLMTVTGSPTVEIRGLGFTGGGGVNGAAILAQGGVLTVRECSLYQNNATDTGGGIAVIGAGNCTLNVTDTTIFANNSVNLGGAIAVVRTSGAATVNLSGATLARNTNSGSATGHMGGGLYLVGGTGPHTVNITASTINDNAIANDGMGGGAFIDGLGGTITIVNSTISGNTCGTGSALAYTHATLTLRSCTITANNAMDSANESSILDVNNTGMLVKNTILSGNIAGGVFRDLAVGQQATGNNNLVGVGGPFVNGASGNIVGVTNPRLVPMNMNGGTNANAALQPQTFALQPDSPALDAGSNADAPATDQRGQMRPSDGNNDGMAIADIGAFETQRYLVTVTDSSGVGTLRQAIIDNNAAGGGFVKFAIPMIGQVQTISPKSPLPAIVRTVVIDAWSQGGQTYQGPPLIEIEGSRVQDTIGLDIQASDCIVRGASVNNFAGVNTNGVGIKISTRAGLRNWVYGCYIGVRPDGVTPMGNGQFGIWIAPTANTNIIGTNADNVRDALERNVISGSTQNGLKTGVYCESNSNIIAGNNIGTDATGTVAIPNFNGVWVTTGSSNQVGTSPFSQDQQAERNVISGNLNVGISFTSQGGNNFVSGNYIGIKGDGSAALANMNGVLLDSVNRTLIGGTSVGERNVISGNIQDGIVVSGATAFSNLIQGNYIGTNPAGTGSIANGLGGIVLRNGVTLSRIGAFGDGSALEPARRNVLSGNVGPGVTIQDAATTNNSVLGNYIGVAADGHSPLGNTNAGVLIIDSPSNTVGAPGSGQNVLCAQISGSNGSGVTITNPNATGNKVQGNLIGVTGDGTSLGNHAAGVTITSGASFNMVGGTQPGQGNTITMNVGTGVRVLSDTSLANSILGNSIVDNGRLGIDLKDDGVTTNGPANFVRTGPNILQNYPVLQTIAPDGTITATLASKASTVYRVEFFSNAAADPSGFGEGKTFLGALNVLTDASGNVGPFLFVAGLHAGENAFSATATELAPANGGDGFPTLPGQPLGTSEFAMVRSMNTPPMTMNQVATGVEDTDLVVTLTATDPDPSTTLTFTVRTLPQAGQLLQFGTLSPLGAPGTAVTDSQGRLVFRPAPNAFGNGYATFDFTASDGFADSNQSTVTVNIAPVPDTPSVTDSATQEDVQSTTGLVITRNPVDGPEVAFFKITAITNGTLFLHDGVTPIVNGSFITAAQGNAGLRYTPGPNFFGNGNFNVQASLTSADSGIGGGAATATIVVSPVADTPSVTDATTLEDTQSTSGLVITRAAVDGPEITNFQISAISTGQLFLSDGVTPVGNGQFITVAQGAAGLRYTPPHDFNGPVTFGVQASIGASTSGLGGGVLTAHVTVIPVNDPPSFTAANPPATLEDGGPATVTGWVTGFSPGPANESDQHVLAYHLTNVTNPSLFTTQPTLDITGTLRYTSAPNANGTAQFTVTVQDDGGTANGGLDTSQPQTFTITVVPVNDPPTFTAANPPAVLEGTGAQSGAGFITGFNPGPPDEQGQQLLGVLVDQVSNPSLFAVQPTVSPSRVLTYTLAPSGYGTSTFRVRVRDNGGTANGGNDTSDPQTFTIVVRPAAVCQDVTIDARLTCVPLTVTPDQINHTPADPGPGATQMITFSRSLTMNFAFGVTPVTVTAHYSDGLVSSCVARVTVLATDCNGNGIPDSCEGSGLGGSLMDCNNDGIPDSCQCLWDDGMVFPTDAPTANGQLSHYGNQVLGKAADDFYLAPNRMYRLFEFRGQLITNTTIHKAQLEFYDDCDGHPADVPFKVFTNSMVETETPGAPGFTMVTYSFNLCDQCFFLEGGKSYWVSLVGLTDFVNPNDASYWAQTTPLSNPSGVMGLPPMKREGLGGPPPYPITYQPWTSAAVCCNGCANLAWKITGEECLVAWDNGKIDLNTAGPTPTAGGSPSDSDTAIPYLPRTADNFIVSGCGPVQVCLVETYIWTNCNPVAGFAEIYENSCDAPALTPIFTAQATTAELIPGATLNYNGSALSAYKLTFCTPGWTLQGSTNYWIASGTVSGNSATSRGLFAYSAPDCHATCGGTRLTPGRFLDHSVSPLAWTATSNDFAFRIAVRGTMGLVNALPGTNTTPACPADFNGDNVLNAQDIFDYLTAWFAGCP